MFWNFPEKEAIQIIMISKIPICATFNGPMLRRNHNLTIKMWKTIGPNKDSSYMTSKEQF